MLAAHRPHRNRLKSFPRTVALALLAALGGGGAARLAAADLPRDRNGWIEVKTANFQLWSDAPERRARAVATELEQLRAALARLSPSLVVASPCPTYIYVFKDRFAFGPYSLVYAGKREEIAGYFAPRPWGNYVALDGDLRTDALHSVRHEYVHFLLHNNYARLPLWLDEGLAEFYGTLQMVDGEARLGQPIREHIEGLREIAPIPLRQLFAVDRSSKDYHEGVRQGVFYAESWALTHYLMVGNPARRPQLTQMVKLIQAGATQEDAFARAFGGDYDGLEHELIVYVHKKIFSYLHAPMDLGAEAPAAVRPMAWPDVLYRLGELLLNSDRPRDAAEHFQAALAANPRHGLAVAGLGEIDEEAGRRAAAAARYEQAAQLAPQEPFVHYLLGRCLLAQAMETNGGRSAGSERAAAELGRAAELAPDFGEVWSQLGLALLSVDATSARATTALETAQRLLPARPDVTLNLALAYASRGEQEKAAAAVKRAEAIHAAPEQLEKARVGLLGADVNAASRLAELGKLDEAAAILERVTASGPRRDVADLAAVDLDRVRHALAHQKFVAAYNQAVGLANSGDTAAAIAQLEKVMAATPPPDPVDAAQAQQLLDKLKARRKARG
jgi:tetratricopeptide (TPR) repeat protein